MGQHHTLGPARGPAGGHDQRIALLDRETIVQEVLIAVGAHHPGRAQGLQNGLPGRGREPWIKRGGGVTGVPDGLQRVDKPRPTREVKYDEFWHCR